MARNTDPSKNVLGMKIAGTAERDAVHVAIAPVVAGHLLKAGDRVKRKTGEFGTSCIVVHPHGDEPAIGIIDPFLPTSVMVEAGERCWVLLFPGTITSLRHEWTHPAFEQPPTEEHVPPGIASARRSQSEKWLRNFVARADCPSYEEVIAAAIAHVEERGHFWDENYLHFDGVDAHGDIPTEFWTHFEIVTGREVPDHLKASRFSCSC